MGGANSQERLVVAQVEYITKSTCFLPYLAIHFKTDTVLVSITVTPD